MAAATYDPAELARVKAMLDAWRAETIEEQRAYFADHAKIVKMAGPPDDRLRVGLVGPCLVQGGAEAWQLALARSTDPARIRWEGAATIADEASTDPAMVAQHRELMPVTFGWAAAAELAQRCDVLVTWAIQEPKKLAGPGRRRAQVVSVLHSPADSDFARKLYARTTADRTVAVSELALAALPASMRHAARVVWNAVDVPRIARTRVDRETKRATWGLGPDAKVAGFLGRLNDEKRPDLMARLAAELPDWQIVLVGSGPERPAMLAHASRLPNLHVLGPDPDAGDVLRALDVLVVPSRYESFGLSLAEGLWCGVPVVSTDVGLARLAPGCTRVVGFDARGPELARAVLDAREHGPTDEARAILPRLDPGRFGREWTDLLIGMRRDPAAMDGTRLGILADLCPAGSGPCGCGSGPPRSCGDPDRPGEVRRSDCIECQARRWWEAGVEAGW